MNIPVLQTSGETIADAYENSIYQLFKKGCRVKTQYDKLNDPPSLDCTLNLTIEKPLSDPMIHKCFPGDLSSLREYVYELEGYKNNWVRDISDENDTRWEYLYSSRMTNWGRYKENGKWAGYFNINQVESVIEKLKNQPYTRQAQIITWYPPHDLNVYDPACLQSLHFRIIDNTLNTNIRFRSNDAFNAFMFNAFGLVQFIKNNILDKIDKNLEFGRLNWQADSYHIYGKDIENCKKMLIDKIENNLPFEKRVMNFYDDYIQEMYKECESAILQKIKDTESNFNK